MTHLNFQVENEIDALTSIFEGIFHQKVLPILKHLVFELAYSPSRDLPPSKCFLQRLFSAPLLNAVYFKCIE